MYNGFVHMMLYRVAGMRFGTESKATKDRNDRGDMKSSEQPRQVPYHAALLINAIRCHVNGVCRLRIPNLADICMRHRLLNRSVIGCREAFVAVEF